MRPIRERTNFDLWGMLTYWEGEAGDRDDALKELLRRQREACLAARDGEPDSAAGRAIADRIRTMPDLLAARG